MPRRLWTIQVAFLLGGACIGLIMGATGMIIMGRRITSTVLAREAVAWVALVATVPGIVAFTKRRARSRARALAGHVLGFLVMVGVHTVLYNTILLVVLRAERVVWVTQAEIFALYDALLYPLVVVAASMARQRRLTRRSELAAARLSRRVAEAELEATRVRLDPNEVVAQLSEVEARVLSDPAGAEQRLYEVSRSLRQKLHRIGTRTPLTPRPRLRRPEVVRDVRPVVFLIYALFGLYMTAMITIWRLIFGAQTWRDLIGTLAAFVVGGLCAAAAIPLFRPALAWRARTAMRRAVAVLVILLFCVSQALIIELLMAGMRRFGLGRALGATFDFVAILSMFTVCMVALDDLKALQRKSRLQSEKLASAVAEARLRSLRTQLAPHFLFNTLNSVLSLMRQDPEGARTMLMRLRSLLRLATDHHERQEVTLREDLGMTRSYLEIEKVRFRDAIDVTINVDGHLLEAYVPAFLLQPLVENAIRHGALSTLGRGTVRVLVERAGALLRIIVRNNGELLDPSGWREGIGLSNTRARLAQMYGPGHELAINVDEGSGVSVSVTIPLRFGGVAHRGATSAGSR